MATTYVETDADQRYGELFDKLRGTLDPEGERLLFDLDEAVGERLDEVTATLRAMRRTVAIATWALEATCDTMSPHSWPETSVDGADDPRQDHDREVGKV